MNGPVGHHPPVALRSIAVFEFGKGLLALAAAVQVICLRHTDLHATLDTFLLRHGFDPETHFKRIIIEWLAKATQFPVSHIIGLAALYAIVRFVEGIGLWHGKEWAEWFAVASIGLYLPLELIHLIRHPTVFSLGLIVVNLGLLLYLAHLLVEQRREAHARPPVRS